MTAWNLESKGTTPEYLKYRQLVAEPLVRFLLFPGAYSHQKSSPFWRYAIFSEMLLWVKLLRSDGFIWHQQLRGDIFTKLKHFVYFILFISNPRKICHSYTPPLLYIITFCQGICPSELLRGRKYTGSSAILRDRGGSASSVLPV